MDSALNSSPVRRSRQTHLSIFIHRLILCTLFLLAGCGNPPYRGHDVLGADEFVMDSYKIREGKFSILELEGKSFGALSPELLQEYKDTIHEGDLLKIAIYHPTREDLSIAVLRVGEGVGFRVLEGKVRLPDLEPIQVQGLTLEEARETVQRAYDHQFKETQVFLTYRDRLERKVELAGLVSIPAFPVDGKIRLFEILSFAKVPAGANLFKSYIVREGQMLPVDLYKLIKEGDMSQNIVMRGGDKIYIADPAASTIMVLGEVGRERSVDLPNGWTTLRQALADAGGIPYTGNRSYIQVIRGNILNPRIYTLTWDHIIHLPSDSLLLMPGDIVYVAATPITEWNRFISQILPTFIAADIVTKGIKSIAVSVP